MRKLIALEHISLDGFVGGPDGELDWAHVDAELFDYFSHLTAEADTAVYGRTTYQMMEAYWPAAADKPGASKHDIEHSRWANAATKIVATRTLDHVDWQNTVLVKDGIEDVIATVKQGPGTNLMLYGSPTLAQALIRANLIDEYWLNVNPVVLGAGKPFFPDATTRLALDLVEAHTFPSGVVALHYRKP